MIGEVTGIRRIRMLYLQLLYRCNYECLHCFHGERLKHADAFTLDEAISLMTLMRDDYGGAVRVAEKGSRSATSVARTVGRR